MERRQKATLYWVVSAQIGSYSFPCINTVDYGGEILPALSRQRLTGGLVHSLLCPVTASK